MEKVVLDPHQDALSVRTASSLLAAVRAAGHVRVAEGADGLTPMTSRERRTLARMAGRDSSSLWTAARILGAAADGSPGRPGRPPERGAGPDASRERSAQPPAPEKTA